LEDEAKIESMKKKITSEYIDIAEEVKKDGEKFVRLFHPVLERLLQKKEKGDNLEAFLLSWGLIEQVIIPSLIRLIAIRLELKTFPKIEYLKSSQLIMSYFLISQDFSMYESLKKGNTLRNQIIHEIASTNLSELDNKLKEARVFIVADVMSPLLDRLSGRVVVPVLTLYSKGWNDAVDAQRKRIDEIRK